MARVVELEKHVVITWLFQPEKVEQKKRPEWAEQPVIRVVERQKRVAITRLLAPKKGE